MLLLPPPPEYGQLRGRIDALADSVHERCRDQLSCRNGCAGCCQVTLTLSLVEAAAFTEYLGQLAPSVREQLSRQVEQSTGQPAPAAGSRCALLDGDDACSIYPARPLVCRSQGLPLRYPSDLVPAEAVRVRLSTGVLTVCPLNFTTRAPLASEALDAERVDHILAVLNHRYCEAQGLDASQRWSLGEIVMAARAG